MADYASSRMSLSRASTLLNRPNQAPQGPRIRNRSSNFPADGYTSPASPSTSSTPSLFTAVNGSTPPYLPEFGQASPTTESEPLSPISETDPKPPAVIPDPPSHPPPSPPLNPPQMEDKPKYTSQSESISELPSTPSPVLTTLQLSSPVASPAPSNLTVKTLSNPPKLTPPPPIKFDSVPVSWKGLPLEAALWTFDSKELQAIVSRAIRSSAAESFIRLLTLENLDNVLPAEIERLEALKLSTQGRYRFLVHRRTMQLQALVSSSLSPNHKDKDLDDGLFTVTKLAVQLSETSAECDQLLEELLKISDQLTQVRKLLDHHWASALAIALRKLNGSYGRRTSELVATRERITQLEAELEDAWIEAEKIAREMDEFDAALSDDDEAVIETAEKISFARLSGSPITHSAPLSPTILNLETLSPFRPISQMQLSQLSPLSPFSPITLKSPVQLRNSRGIETVVDISDTVSIKSSRSNKSGKSTIRGEGSRTSLVSAAKKRSHRASQSSLRLPSSLHRKRSSSRPKTPHDGQPPVPDLPLQFTSPIMSTSSANASSALFHFDNDSVDGSKSHFSVHTRRRTSLDSARVTSGHQTPIMWGSRAMDDLYVKPQKVEGVASLGRWTERRRLEEDEIQLVPRTPPLVPVRTIPMEQYMSRPTMTTKERHPNQTIPSIWMNADAPKTPAERVDSMHQNSKGKTYQRLRTLTKRYSLPFPMFASKSNSSGQREESRPTSHRSG